MINIILLKDITSIVFNITGTLLCVMVMIDVYKKQ